MRQRVAVARALATEPRILLLDEPLGALDALTRATLQDEIGRILDAEQRSAVLVTNDVDEALLLADRIVPLSPGPGAQLRPGFRVGLERPRDRAALNHDPAFKKLRNEVTHLLGAPRRSGAASGKVRPPADLRPASCDEPHVEIPGSQRFGPPGTAPVVEGFDLNLAPGEFVCLIGHSGCGKSTVLSIVAGLTEASAGGVILGGREIAGAGPDRGVVFQAPSLLPWLTAFENVKLGVDRVYPHGTPEQRRAIASHYLERVGLGGLGRVRPRRLRGVADDRPRRGLAAPADHSPLHGRAVLSRRP